LLKKKIEKWLTRPIELAATFQIDSDDHRCLLFLLLCDFDECIPAAGKGLEVHQ
jgi:hypothetical protein